MSPVDEAAARRAPGDSPGGAGAPLAWGMPQLAGAGDAGCGVPADRSRPQPLQGLELRSGGAGTPGSGSRAEADVNLVAALDEVCLGAAVSLATDSARSGGGPFGAVMALDGRVIGSGFNRVTADFDPTAHAEVVAIRDACRSLRTFALRGATLYASCEPCPLCLSAALWARVSRVVFAADRRTAGEAGFDDAAFHRLFADGDTSWPLDIVQLQIPGDDQPFAAWLTNSARIPH